MKNLMLLLSSVLIISITLMAITAAALLATAHSSVVWRHQAICVSKHCALRH